MVTPLTRLKAGVSVPDSPLITEVIEYAQKLSEPYLFNHAMRSRSGTRPHPKTTSRVRIEIFRASYTRPFSYRVLRGEPG